MPSLSKMKWPVRQAELKTYTFSFPSVIVTGGSSFPSDRAGDREVDTIGELTSNLVK